MASTEDKYQVDDDKHEEETACDRRLRSIKHFIWNPQTGQILSRTGSSWAKIIVFYLGFYSALAALCAVMFVVLLTTMDKEIPTWVHGNESMILQTPGASQIPIIVDTAANRKGPVLGLVNKIEFNMNDASTYQGLIGSLTQVAQDYQNPVSQTIRACHGSQEQLGTCTYPAGALGACNGSDPNFGYDKGAPCFFIKLNKVINWFPESFDVNPSSDLLGNRWSTNHVPISCQGVSDKDQQNMGPVQYFPEHGLPFNCFPYCGAIKSETYVRPPQMVKFLSPVRNKAIGIWCRAWSANIWTENVLDAIKSGAKAYRREHYGSVTFSLLIEE